MPRGRLRVVHLDRPLRPIEVAMMRDASGEIASAVAVNHGFAVLPNGTYLYHEDGLFVAEGPILVSHPDLPASNGGACLEGDA